MDARRLAAQEQLVGDLLVVRPIASRRMTSASPAVSPRRPRDRSAEVAPSVAASSSSAIRAWPARTVMSRASGAAPSAAAIECAARRASAAAFREPRDASCRALTVPGVGDEEGSVEDAPQVRDRRPGGSRAPRYRSSSARQRGERRGARIPAGPRSIRSIPSSINAGRPAVEPEAGPVSGELGRPSPGTDDMPRPSRAWGRACRRT